MQTDLRLLLFIIGLVLGGYVLFHSARFRRFKKPSFAFSERTAVQADPLLEDFLDEVEDQDGGGIIDEGCTQEIARAPEIVQEPQPQPQPQTRDIFDEPIVLKTKPQSSTAPQTTAIKNDPIVITILSKQPTGFSGDQLQAALKANNFDYSKQKIFQRHINDNPLQPALYAVVSLTEPGIFNLHTMAKETFKGIMVFMQVPCRHNSLLTFEKMLSSARKLSAYLNGALCDNYRQPLTTERITKYRQIAKENEKANV